MSLSNNLLNKITIVKAHYPDRQLLLNGSLRVKTALDDDVILSQLKYCIDKGIEDDCYKKLLEILTIRYGKLEVQHLCARYKRLCIVKK